MDDDLIFMICFFLFVLSLPVLVIFGAAGCVAASRTREWARKKNSAAFSFEQPLINKSDEAESDEEILDSEDEAYCKSKQDAKIEEQADMLLTKKQKFRKEFKKAMKGRGHEQVEQERKNKEREERKLLAKEVVREMRRLERRQARMEGKSELPTYGSAVAKQ